MRLTRRPRARLVHEFRRVVAAPAGRQVRRLHHLIVRRFGRLPQMHHA